MDKIEVNRIVEGQITGVTKYGVFVSLEDHYTGMIHISEVSNKYIVDLEKKFKIGDLIKVKVISIDEDKLQVKLSLKKIKYQKKPIKKIKETKLGFEPLFKQLPLWINKKTKELEKKQ